MTQSPVQVIPKDSLGPHHNHKESTELKDWTLICENGIKNNYPPNCI